MKKKKLIMTVLFICLAALAVLSGCQFSGTMLDDNYKNEGYYKVTLFYNGGAMNGSYYHDRFIPQNSRLPYPGTNSGPIINPTRSGHALADWYQIDSASLRSRTVNRTKTVVDANGVATQEEVYDQAGNVIEDVQYYIEGHDYMNGGIALSLTDLEEEDPIFIKKWNFEIDRVKDDIVLVPLWSSTREYVYITEADSLKDPNDDYFKSQNAPGGTYRYTLSMNADGSIRKPSSLGMTSIPQIASYQVEGLYLDSRFINEIKFDSKTGLYYPEETYTDGKLDRFAIYVRHISDSYTIVNSASDLNYGESTNREYMLYANSSTGGYKGLYLRANIDLNGGTLNFRTTTAGQAINFNADIRGNGYTISNFVTKVKQTATSSSYGAIFATINNANIQGVTFDNFTVKFQRVKDSANYLSRLTTVNALANAIPSSATLKDVRVTNMTVVDVPDLGFDPFSFENNGTNERLEVWDGKNLICLTPGNPMTSLSTYTIRDQIAWSGDKSDWSEFRQELQIGQTDDNFGVGIENRAVSGCSVKNVALTDWTPDYIREIDDTDYYRLPNLGTIIGTANYEFYGWFDIYGYQYGLGFAVPEEGQAITVYAMFALKKS